MRTVEPTDAAGELHRLLTSAARSVLARSNVHLTFIPGVATPTLVDILRHRPPVSISLRAILGVMEREGEYDESLLKVVMNETACIMALRKDELRLSFEWSGCHGVIVDGSRALIARHKMFFDMPDEVFVLENIDELSEYLELFENHWRYTPAARSMVRQLDDLSESDGHRLYVASEQYWGELIRSLAEHPKDLFSLPPRKFEELVAELLSRKGMDVQITPAVRDGGRDILAWCPLPFGRSLYLVECKRYSPNRPIGVGLVRHLYGVVEAERATAGVLVTTSRFTSAAWGFQETTKWRLHLADYESLIAWLARERDI